MRFPWMIGIILLSTLIVSGCSIDWNNEKDKRITELELEIAEIQNRNEIETIKYQEQKEEKYREKCVENRKAKEKIFEQVISSACSNTMNLNTCVEGVVSKAPNVIVPDDYVEKCTQDKMNKIPVYDY